MSEAKWFLRTMDETFGPETEEKLVEWAKLGRIQPGQEISDDNLIWKKVEEIPFLDMRFSIDIGDGNPRGPFNRAAAEALLASGRLPPTTTIVEVRGPFAVEEPKAEVPVEEVPVTEAAPVEVPATEPEPRVIEKVVEKIVEVPVEKIVEKVVEKEVVREVPVEKIVEKVVEKVVVDETRVKELEELLTVERRHMTELTEKLDAASMNAAAERANAVKSASEALARENNLKTRISEMTAATEAAEKANAEKFAACEEQIKSASERADVAEAKAKELDDELRRLPQQASEVADIQAAVYSIMTKEAEEIAATIEAEKKEMDEVRRRYQERADRLLERRRTLLKQSGGNIEEMTRKALFERPEDPRTVQLRKELDELRRLDERKSLEATARIRELTDRLALKDAEFKRVVASAKDITQLQLENQRLREELGRREKELTEERQASAELRQREAMNQQAMMARLAALESPSIGTSSSMSTNQSREARQVKLPGWMRIGK